MTFICVFLSVFFVPCSQLAFEVSRCSTGLDTGPFFNIIISIIFGTSRFTFETP